MTPGELKIALGAWEDAVLNAHCGDAARKPLHTTAILILAGDKLAEILRGELKDGTVLRETVTLSCQVCGKVWQADREEPCSACALRRQ